MNAPVARPNNGTLGGRRKNRKSRRSTMGGRRKDRRNTMGGARRKNRKKGGDRRKSRRGRRSRRN